MKETEKILEEPIYTQSSTSPSHIGKNPFQKWLISHGYYRDDEGVWLYEDAIVTGKEMSHLMNSFKNECEHRFDDLKGITYECEKCGELTQKPSEIFDSSTFEEATRDEIYSKSPVPSKEKLDKENNELREKTLEDWCKAWSLNDLAGKLTSMGMAFMSDGMTEKELLEERAILVKEIERRLHQREQQIYAELMEKIEENSIIHDDSCIHKGVGWKIDCKKLSIHACLKTKEISIEKVKTIINNIFKHAE